mmetsp:Transcript_26949/g.54259  ORF Transcript_26949/g.54259 Transcript_26949/m.54259 type:complete len:215 (-) Transcript_26949:289-933(-)
MLTDSLQRSRFFDEKAWNSLHTLSRSSSSSRGRSASPVSMRPISYTPAQMHPMTPICTQNTEEATVLQTSSTASPARKNNGTLTASTLPGMAPRLPFSKSFTHCSSPMPSKTFPMTGTAKSEGLAALGKKRSLRTPNHSTTVKRQAAVTSRLPIDNPPNTATVEDTPDWSWRACSASLALSEEISASRSTGTPSLLLSRSLGYSLSVRSTFRVS